MPFYVARFQTTESNFQAIVEGIVQGKAFKLVPTKNKPNGFDVLAGPDLIASIVVDAPEFDDAKA